MNNQEILSSLREIFSKIKPSLDVTTVTEDTALVSDLGLDSLTILLLSLAIETSFGIKFEGTPRFEKVGDVIGYISERL